MCIFFLHLCSLDATTESKSGPKLGRLVNHGEKDEVNCKMECLNVTGSLALVLFAVKDIAIGQELLYDYGVSNLPWKQKKVSMKMSRREGGTCISRWEKKILLGG